MTRNQLLSALTEWLVHFLDEEDVNAVLDDTAIAQARHLAVIAESATAAGGPDIASHTVLALLHWYRFQILPAGDDIADLNAALPHFRAISGADPESIPEPLKRPLTSARTSLARLMIPSLNKAADYITEFEQSGRLEVLNAAINLLRQLLGLYLPGQRGHPEVLGNLGAALLGRFGHDLDTGDLDAAITVLRQAVATTPLDYPFRSSILVNLGTALETRFEVAHQLRDLDAAIDLAAEAARSFPPEEIIYRAGALSNLSIALRMRFKYGGGQRSDLDAAITAAQQSLNEVPADYAGRARLLSTLSNALLNKFELTHDRSDLDAGIAASQQSFDATPATHLDRSKMLMNLGSALRDRFEYARQITDLNTAISMYNEAARGAPPGGRGDCLYNLGSALRMRFRQTLQRADLDTAVIVLQQAADSLPEGHPRRADCLSNLGGTLLELFEQTTNQADLDAAIVASRHAVDATPDGDAALIGYLGTLGLALRARSQQTGNLADIDAAIAPRQQALDASSEDDPRRAGMLSDLAVVLLDRFETGGQPTDLDTAVDLLGGAVEIARHGDPHRARHLANLGSVLITRWRSGGPERDLDTAIELFTEAVGTAQADDPDNSMYKSNLGNTLLDRFDRTRQQHDLDTAIELFTQAADPALPSRYRRAVALSNLARALQKRYERSRDPGDLDAAIGNLRTALDITDPDHAGRAPMLANLAETLQARFKLNNDPGDLDVAIVLSRQAADATPEDHTNRAMRLTKLGQILLSRFEKAGKRGDTDDLMESVRCWRAAADNATASWETRIMAAWAWGQVAEEYLEPALALQGYSAAVGLLPATVWHGAERSAQEEHLTRWSSLATDAAACAITAGEPRRAVEMLEQGRSVLWTQALSLRSDVSRLREQAPDLAARLEQIRDALDQPSTSTLNGELIDPAAESGAGARAARHHAVEDRRRLTRAWDDLVAQVRRLPGFRHFLAPVPFPALQAAAQSGAVVMVNVSRRACHALMIRAVGDPGVEVLPLSDTSRADIGAQANKLIGVLDRARGISRPFLAWEADRDAVFDVLAWLWHTITGPVLDVLGHTSAHSGSSAWPRIWWCPTGPLACCPCMLPAAIPAAPASPHRRPTPCPAASSRPTPPLWAAFSALARFPRQTPATPGSSSWACPAHLVNQHCQPFPTNYESQPGTSHRHTKPITWWDQMLHVRLFWGPSPNTPGRTSPATRTRTRPIHCSAHSPCMTDQ